MSGDLTREEIAGLKWEGPCPTCGKKMTRHGNAAYGMAVDGKAARPCGLCQWRTDSRESIEHFEADTNSEGLADYIEELRAAAKPVTCLDPACQHPGCR